MTLDQGVPLHIKGEARIGREEEGPRVLPSLWKRNRLVRRNEVHVTSPEEPLAGGSELFKIVKAHLKLLLSLFRIEGRGFKMGVPIQREIEDVPFMELSRRKN